MHYFIHSWVHMKVCVFGDNAMEVLITWKNVKDIGLLIWMRWFFNKINVFLLHATQIFND